MGDGTRRQSFRVMYIVSIPLQDPVNRDSWKRRHKFNVLYVLKLRLVLIHEVLLAKSTVNHNRCKSGSHTHWICGTQSPFPVGLSGIPAKHTNFACIHLKVVAVCSRCFAEMATHWNEVYSTLPVLPMYAYPCYPIT